MNKIIDEKIHTVFEGKATIHERQNILSQASDSAFDNFLNDAILREKYEQYQEHNPVPAISDVYISKKQIDESWQKIIERTKNTPFSYKRFLSNLKGIVQDSFSFERTFWKYGAVMAILLVSVPILYHARNDNLSPHYNTMRGPVVKQQAILEYSILGHDNKLHRPDRAIHESDTLFFRVEAKEDGYCSLYMIFNGQAEVIVSDKFLKQGSHDLASGYKLIGNRGENSLVLVFSRLPVSMDKEYIMASIHNKVKALTVNETPVTIFQTDLRVE